MGRHGYPVKEGAETSGKRLVGVSLHRLFFPVILSTPSFCPAGLCSALLQRSALVNPGSLRDPAVPGGNEPATLPGVLGPPAVAGRMKAETPASATRSLPVAESRVGQLGREGEAFSTFPTCLLPDDQFLFPHLCFKS